MSFSCASASKGYTGYVIAMVLLGSVLYNLQVLATFNIVHKQDLSQQIHQNNFH
jgi:hypothetical protein